jgi:hypothetical protein
VTAFLSRGITQRRGRVEYWDGFVEQPAGSIHYDEYGAEGEVLVATLIGPADEARQVSGQLGTSISCGMGGVT